MNMILVTLVALTLLLIGTVALVISVAITEAQETQERLDKEFEESVKKSRQTIKSVQ